MKKRKLLAAILNNPDQVHFDDLIAVALWLGFALDRITQDVLKVRAPDLGPSQGREIKAREAAATLAYCSIRRGAAAEPQHRDRDFEKVLSHCRQPSHSGSQASRRCAQSPTQGRPSETLPSPPVSQAGRATPPLAPGHRSMTEYHINVFWSTEDDAWVADIPDLQYCSAHGATATEALAEVIVARDAWLAAARDNGLPIPPPKYRPAIYQVAG